MTLRFAELVKMKREEWDVILFQQWRGAMDRASYHRDPQAEYQLRHIRELREKLEAVTLPLEESSFPEWVRSHLPELDLTRLPIGWNRKFALGENAVTSLLMQMLDGIGMDEVQVKWSLKQIRKQLAIRKAAE